MPTSKEKQLETKSLKMSHKQTSKNTNDKQIRKSNNTKKTSLLHADRISSKKYDSIFPSGIKTPPISVDPKVWKKILQSTPSDYQIPDPEIVDLFLKNAKTTD